MHTRASPFLVWVMAMCCVSAVAGRAHELETDRLTVIQREPNHLALTLRIDEIALMQRLLAPGSTRNEFLLACVALPPEALENKLSRARTLFAAQFSVRDDRGRIVPLQGWQWPKLQVSRQRLSEAALALIATGEAHVHAAPAELIADAVATRPLERASIVQPESLPDLTVVSYRPTQRRATTPGKPLPLRF